MRKILLIAAIAILQLPAIIYASDACTQPSNWTPSNKWHFNAVFNCHDTRCTLVDRSGGVPDPDPRKNNYWNNIYWTFSRNGIPIASDQCTAFPLNPACDFNEPRHTCAALYLMHTIINEK